MGSAKLQGAPPPQRYADEPRPKAGRTASSSVSLHTLDEDDQPPPYADAFYDDATARPSAATQANGTLYAPCHPPGLAANDRTSTNCYTTWTQHLGFSTEPEQLAGMIEQQSLYPPVYHMQVHGEHKETVRRNNKDEKNTVIDFDIWVDLTSILAEHPGQGVACRDGRVRLIQHGERGYRGGVLPSKQPHYGSGPAITLGSGNGYSDDAEEPIIEQTDIEREGGEDIKDALLRWCEAYCNNKAGWKSFRLQRVVDGFDEAKLVQLIKGAVRETRYLGDICVSFRTQKGEVVVLSPGKINTWRTIVWVRWFFYLTMLWIISWPTLFFMTKKYDVVKAVFPFRVDGRAVVKEEAEWFEDWEQAIKRAATNRMQCEIDESYRQQTLAAVARGEALTRDGPVTTGNAAVDGIVSVAQMGFNFMGNRRGRGDGWGANC